MCSGSSQGRTVALASDMLIRPARQCCRAYALRVHTENIDNNQRVSRWLMAMRCTDDSFSARVKHQTACRDLITYTFGIPFQDPMPSRTVVVYLISVTT